MGCGDSAWRGCGADVGVGVSADVGVERVLCCECGCAGVGAECVVVWGCGMKLRNFGTSWVWVFVCSGMELALK